MKKNSILLLLAILTLFSGCATNPTSFAVNSPPKVIQPPKDKAMVVFVRVGKLFPQVIHVFDGDKYVASVKGFQKSYVFMEPGHHKMAFTQGINDLFDIAYVEGELEAGGIYYLALQNWQYGMLEGPGFYTTATPCWFDSARKGKEAGDNSMWLAYLMKNELVQFDKAKAKVWLENYEYKDFVQPSYLWGKQYQNWKALPQEKRATFVKSDPPQITDKEGNVLPLNLHSKNL